MGESAKLRLFSRAITRAPAGMVPCLHAAIAPMKPISSARVKSRRTSSVGAPPARSVRSASNAESAAAAAAKSSQADVCTSPAPSTSGFGSVQVATSPRAISSASSDGALGSISARYIGNAALRRQGGSPPASRGSPSLRLAISTAGVVSGTRVACWKYEPWTPPRNPSSTTPGATMRSTTNAGWSRWAVISSGPGPLASLRHSRLGRDDQVPGRVGRHADVVAVMPHLTRPTPRRATPARPRSGPA